MSRMDGTESLGIPGIEAVTRRWRRGRTLGITRRQSISERGKSCRRLGQRVPTSQVTGTQEDRKVVRKQGVPGKWKDRSQGKL